MESHLYGRRRENPLIQELAFEQLTLVRQLLKGERAEKLNAEMCQIRTRMGSDLFDLTLLTPDELLGLRVVLGNYEGLDRRDQVQHLIDPAYDAALSSDWHGASPTDAVRKLTFRIKKQLGRDKYTPQKTAAESLATLILSYEEDRGKLARNPFIKNMPQTTRSPCAPFIYVGHAHMLDHVEPARTKAIIGSIDMLLFLHKEAIMNIYTDQGQRDRLGLVSPIRDMTSSPP